METLPIDAEPAQIIAALEARCRRFETACGEGRLVWRVWGSGGPPVLLAHGGGGSWLHWIRNIESLAESRRVWAVDLPGYGESAMPPEAEHRAIAEVLAAGLRELLPRELPIDAVGFSFGGVVVAQLAAFHSEIVRRLILVDAGGLETPLGKIHLQRMRELDGEARRAASRANLLALMLHKESSVDALALHLEAIQGARARLNPTPLVLPDRLLEVLPHIAAPIDAIWGEHDRPHPEPALQEAVLRRFQPDLEFRVVPDAGHWAMYENAEVFNRTLLELLARPLRRGAEGGRALEA